jgi:Putative beta-barrel porin-2, OmpL-like. bbp2
MKKTVQLLALLLTTTFALAQDKATTFAGSADLYYRYDFANQVANNKTSFTSSSNSFELGMASIEATHKMGKASLFADLGFGNRAKDFSYNDKANGNFLIKQLNVTYDFSDKFKVTFGSFGTHLGYELVDAIDNKNYSMSYAFTNGPFFNTGIKAQYNAGKIGLMFGISNPTDFKSAIDGPRTNQKTYIGQVSYTAETGSVYLNLTSGSDNPITEKNLTQIDVVASKKLNDKFSLGFNGTYAIIKDDNSSEFDQNWFAVIGYACYTMNPKLSLAYRVEYFDDKDGAKYLTNDNNIFANTLSLNFKEGNFTFIPEVRFDNATKDIFLKSDGAPTSSAGSILFATTYSF